MTIDRREQQLTPSPDGQGCVGESSVRQSAATLLQHLLEFADLESRHAMRQWHRCRWGELLTHPEYYTGRHSGMTIMIAEIQRLMQEKAKLVEHGCKTPSAD